MLHDFAWGGMMLKEVWFSSNIVQYSLVPEMNKNVAFVQYYLMRTCSLSWLCAIFHPWQWFIMIFFAHCQVRVQVTDGKGTKSESINLSQSSNTNDFVFSKGKREGKGVRPGKERSILRYWGRSVSRNFLGKPVYRRGCFRQILSSSFLIRELWVQMLHQTRCIRLQ